MATTTRSFRNYIDGEWVDAVSGETFDSTSPADGELIGTFPRSDADDVDRAVAAAQAAFEDWRLVPAGTSRRRRRPGASKSTTWTWH